MDPMVEGGVGYALGGAIQLAEMAYVTSGKDHESKLNRTWSLIGMEIAMTVLTFSFLYFGCREKDSLMTNIGVGLLFSRANWLALVDAKVL
jgi:hypothetical protein